MNIMGIEVEDPEPLDDRTQEHDRLHLEGLRGGAARREGHPDPRAYPRGPVRGWREGGSVTTNTKYATARVCTTPTLRILEANGVALGLNQRIQVPEDIDPDGAHLLIMLLFGHNMDAGTEMHHRVQVYMKRKDSDEAIIALMDIMDDDWQALQPASSLVAEEGPDSQADLEDGEETDEPTT